MISGRCDTGLKRRQLSWLDVWRQRGCSSRTRADTLALPSSARSFWKLPQQPFVYVPAGQSSAATTTTSSALVRLSTTHRPPLGGAVVQRVRHLGLRLAISRSRVQIRCLHLCASVTKQYNLVPTTFSGPGRAIGPVCVCVCQTV